MIAREEQAFIKKFVIKDKQERYLGFLSKDKTRRKFMDALYHFDDFKWELFSAISGSEWDIVAAKVKSNKNISTCSVISADDKFDGKVMPVDEAINNVIGTEGTVLIFGNADVVYFEGEGPYNRYISI
jgi:hypothetical protein